MKNKIIYISVIGVIFCVFVVTYFSYSYSNKIVTNIKNDNIDDSSTVSMMIETSINSGDYELSQSTSWPTSGYVFNEELSYCKSGSTFIYNSDTNSITLNVSVSDSCYMYFDIISTIDDVCDDGDNLSECIQTLYSVTGEGTVGIYYFDGSGDYTNSDQEYVDYSYRYSGASDFVNNYVCFGSDDCTVSDNLYRNIGIFQNDTGDYEVKLIKSTYCTSDLCGEDGDYAGDDSYYWNYNFGTAYVNTNYSIVKTSTTTNDNILAADTVVEPEACYYSTSSTKGSNDWSETKLNTVNLNTNYLNNIGGKWSNLVTTHTWIVGGNSFSLMQSNSVYNYELINYITADVTPTCTDKIGLLYISDYAYAVDPLFWTTEITSYSSEAYLYDWMYTGFDEWSITRHACASNVNYIESNGDRSYYLTDSSYIIRPTFYLSSSVEYSSGSGTQSNPIILNVDNS